MKKTLAGILSGLSLFASTMGVAQERATVHIEGKVVRERIEREEKQTELQIGPYKRMAKGPFYWMELEQQTPEKNPRIIHSGYIVTACIEDLERMVEIGDRVGFDIDKSALEELKRSGMPIVEIKGMYRFGITNLSKERQKEIRREYQSGAYKCFHGVYISPEPKKELPMRKI